jgi:hypothetical protein
MVVRPVPGLVRAAVSLQTFPEDRGRTPKECAAPQRPISPGKPAGGEAFKRLWLNKYLPLVSLRAASHNIGGLALDHYVRASGA